MKKVFNILLFLVFLSSCEEEKLPELVNPRFSVAYIQESNSEGVTFGAEVISLGKHEVLEYGFALSNSHINSLEDGILFKKTGPVENNFEIKTYYFLTTGKVYFVAAYFITTNGTIISQQREYMSTDSRGFVFEKLVHEEKIYYNDPIRLYGENISDKVGEFNVKINNEVAEVLSVTEEYIEVLIPDNIYLPHNGIAHFDVSVSNLNRKFDHPLSLRDPEFEYSPNRIVKLSEPIVIKGKYLRSFDSDIKVQGNPFEVQMIGEATDSTITFNPHALFPSANPTINVNVREKSYDVQNNFILAPIEFIFGQSINLKANEKTTIKGSNFNTFFPIDYYLIFDREAVIYDIHDVKENEFDISFRPMKAFTDDEITIKLISHGQFSQNQVNITIKDPRSIIMDLPSNASRFTRKVKNRIYYVADGNIYEIDPLNKTYTIKTTLPSFSEKINYVNMILESNDKLYISHFDQVDSNYSHKFIEYDPTTNSITILPDIPIGFQGPLTYFSLGNYIYIQHVKNIDNSSGNPLRNDLLRFNLINNTWESSAINLGISDIAFPSFSHNGEIFSLIGYRSNSNDTRLMKFNFGTNQWNFIKSFAPISLPYPNSMGSSIGNLVYFGTFEGGYSLNMNTLSLEKISLEINEQNSPFQFGSALGDFFYYPMEINGKMKLIEFNPSK
ncbi:hypothetical protein SAMN06295967_11260 [Belliella buryatensis]|uniref:IPT/TIG domain-containing protein n=1 Tax=Belliella buryatensis TaxID=1500549 RepID=A0A239FD87_9BACT|nr:hypothetical protein [Belliella buryatensis]SNS54899.1 hypothetical protein SAMN06295967_11260 [Belliella buryatensis]